jgi:hypothetical protein
VTFIHIPRTGGTSIAAQIGSSTFHYPARAFAGPTFAVVRNPYDRAVSICASQFDWTSDPLPVEVFEEWVKNDMWADVVNRGTVWELPYAAPQCCFVDDSTEVFQFENYGAVLAGVQRLTGIELDDRRLKESRHLRWREYYSKSSVCEIVGHRYRLDFEAFDYPNAILRPA